MLSQQLKHTANTLRIGVSSIAVGCIRKSQLKHAANKAEHLRMASAVWCDTEPREDRDKPDQAPASLCVNFRREHCGTSVVSTVF